MFWLTEHSGSQSLLCMAGGFIALKTVAYENPRSDRTESSVNIEDRGS